MHQHYPCVEDKEVVVIGLIYGLIGYWYACLPPTPKWWALLLYLCKTLNLTPMLGVVCGGVVTAIYLLLLLLLLLLC